MTLASLAANRAREIVSRFPGLPVLVVGDVMLDRFVVGRVTRISPEAPVPVVRFVHEHVRLGGAANVAHNLAALGARAALVGVVGADEAGRRLRAALAAAGISEAGLLEDAGRLTVEKVRVVTERNQQVARIDYESDEDVTGDVAARLIDRIHALAPDAKALLVSDYLKGIATQANLDALVAMKKASGVPLLVDPKIPNLVRYKGASLITPNNHEAEAATGRRITTDEDARAAAADFRARTSADAVLITRGEHGMWLSSDDAEGGVPARAREVADVTGAGDTVVATLALALAAGATLAEAAVLANHAAGVVVSKFGAATVSPAELLSTFSQTG
ncbi:MAG TPA: D-glycero-beta-D-manno-heptose-7-phosphate kinase [Vicinamibacterales bacterium]|jgi:D-beta-D-heptose 7-phosphate kinase/D-beta-D-heptose 1-phosphate adenosyltransferase|nr:D-glycero-beta-D-manno-heptose-7-phosphate kinase [Vicinamibacterales bacterium]